MKQKFASKEYLERVVTLLPKEMDRELKFYSLKNNTSKSEVIRNLVTKFLERERKKDLKEAH